MIDTLEQRVMTHRQWIECGGWDPAVGADDDDVVIACVNTGNGAVVWVSWSRVDHPVDTRAHPDVPVVDVRPRTDTD